MTPSALERMLRPLRNRLAQIASRAVISLTDDSGPFQEHQLDALADETMDGVERMAEYGLYSNPPKGSEAVIVSVGGVRSHAVVIATHHRDSRLKDLLPGEVAIADDQGQVVKIGRNGITIVTAKTIAIEAQGAMTIQAASLAITGDTTVTGKLTVSDTATLQGDLDVIGDVALGNGATKYVKLSDDTPATKVKAK